MLMSYNAADLDDFRIVGDKGDLFASPAFSVGVAIKHTITIGEEKTNEEFPKTDHFGGELKYFSDCILNGKDPEADGEEGLLDVRVFAAIEKALETGKPQKLGPYHRKRRPTQQNVETLKAVKPPELVGAHKPSEGQ
jgi:predicted dehydrogenase